MEFHTEITEIFGYIAAVLVLGAFVMRTMIPLRIIAIVSNLAFMTYGFIGGLLPVLLLHIVLLPVNIYRLTEMLRLVRDAAPLGTDLSWLAPYMKLVGSPAGTVLFREGDEADAMFLLISGRIRLDEFAVEIGPGEVVGEMGVFSSHGKRTATATCLADCSLHRITRDKVRELAMQNPQFGFYLIGIISDRLIVDLDKIKQGAAAAVPAAAVPAGPSG
jgi:CRP/FNR family transcriptional regulator, cyclic AMP receptor protein